MEHNALHTYINMDITNTKLWNEESMHMTL